MNGTIDKVPSNLEFWCEGYLYHPSVMYKNNDGTIVINCKTRRDRAKLLTLIRRELKKPQTDEMREKLLKVLQAVKEFEVK
jgi:hypothetical protein